jgi:hypothetical protein
MKPGTGMCRLAIEWERLYTDGGKPLRKAAIGHIIRQSSWSSIPHSTFFTALHPLGAEKRAETVKAYCAMDARSGTLA